MSFSHYDYFVLSVFRRSSNVLGLINLQYNLFYFYLEAHCVGTVLDDLEFSGIDVDVTVFALNSAVRESGLQFERPVRALVTVGVRAVLVVSANLNSQQIIHLKVILLGLFGET